MECISKFLRIAATDTETLYWVNKLKTSYGIDYELNPDIKSQHILLRQVYRCLSIMPEALVRACHVSKVIFKDLGPSKPHYPNHGYYSPLDDSIVLNSQMFYNPDQPEDFFSKNRFYLDRIEQTVLHEWAHAFDENHSKLSLQEPWMKLSGWSEEQKPGLTRLIIDDPGTPKVIGEYWYDPKIGKFPRFYSSRNPYDDFADNYAYWTGNLRDKIPATKREYFDKLLGKYYK